MEFIFRVLLPTFFITSLSSGASMAGQNEAKTIDTGLPSKMESMRSSKSWYPAALANKLSAEKLFNRMTIPVQVTVTASNKNTIETISICNTSSSTIPLTDLELDFNFSTEMATNIWGNPYVAWHLVNQAGTAVTLKGGTPYASPLLPDPNCRSPLTVEFSNPAGTVPSGPFVFKATAGQTIGSGTLSITLAAAPAAALAAPTIKVAKASTSSVIQTQSVAWGASWQLTGLIPGRYNIISSLLSDGKNFYKTLPVSVNVLDGKTTQQTVTYQAVPNGTLKVTLNNAPTSPIVLLFSGKNFSFKKSAYNGSLFTMPYDSYTVSSSVAGYNATYTVNPVTIPSVTALGVTYTKSQSLHGPYTTLNSQILDGSKSIVSFKGVSWFGFDTSIHLINGLWMSDFDTMLTQLKTLGFNAVRLPFKFDFILDETILPSGLSTSCNNKPCNADIPTNSAWHAFQVIVKKFTDNGIYVLLDNQSNMDNTYVASQTQWIAGWKKIAMAFYSNPDVGYDIMNEPDSLGITWDGTTNGTSWTVGATAAMNAIYQIDQKKLFFIEGTGQVSGLGTDWGDGFATDATVISKGISNPTKFFTQLLNQPYLNQVVLSPHIYGPDGTNNQGTDYSDPIVAFADWARQHGYLYNNFSNVNGSSSTGFCVNGNCRVYPLVYGEFGGKFDPADPYYAKDVATLTNLATFMKQLAIGKPAATSWFYWAWNPNSGNTGGILKNDWATVDCNKINFLKNNLNLSPAAGICP